MRRGQTNAGSQHVQRHRRSACVEQTASGNYQTIQLFGWALPVRRAAHAGAITSGFGISGITEEADAVTPRPARRAAWAAEDTGRADGEYEAAIEACIAFAEGLPAAFEIDHFATP